MFISDYAICLVALIIFSVFGMREYGFRYQMALAASSCALFSIVFYVTYVIAG